MRSEPGADRLPAGAFFLLMASVFAVSVGYGIALPVLPFLLQGLMGEGARFSLAVHTGLLAGLYMFALFLFAPLWGCVSDRIGRRPVILLGLGGCVLAVVSFGLARTLELVYLARALGGVMVSAVLPVALAYIGDATSEELRARRFAWMSAATTLGFLVGPALGGSLTRAAPVSILVATVPGNALPFVLAASAGLLIWVAVYFRLPEASARAVPASQAVDPIERSPKSIHGLLLLAFLGTLGLGSFEVAVALQAQQVLKLDPFRVSVLFMECSLLMVVVQAFVFSPLVKHFGFGHIVAPAFLVMVVGLGLLPIAADFGWVVLLVGLVAAGSGVLAPMLAYQISIDAATAQGAALGKQTAARSLGQGLGSVMAGGLFGVAAEAPFWSTAGVLLVGALLGLRLVAARQ